MDNQMEELVLRPFMWLMTVSSKLNDYSTSQTKQKGLRFYFAHLIAQALLQHSNDNRWIFNSNSNWWINRISDMQIGAQKKREYIKPTV